MKVYTISDRQLREFANVVWQEAQRPLLKLIRNLMRELQEFNEDLAELNEELNAVGGDDAPPIAPRD